MFPGSMASGNVSSRSKNNPLGASNDKFEVVARPRSGDAPHSDIHHIEVKYFYQVYCWAVLAALGGALGQYRVLFDVPTSNLSFEVSIGSFWDRLDTFSDAIDPGNMLGRLVFRLGGHRPDISGTGKI